MWHLQSIRATNLCSFLELDYTPKQGEATLIFGNNLDSDSQNSNGSGKSALIEAIAIALTGEPLRKVNADEIINDTQDEATITAVLTNAELGEKMTINRRLSRKQPQLIQVVKQTDAYDDDTEEIKQATVADYNKYILDQIGLSKDDIFGNFILTARKYKSFLASSDKEKKEIINRFSNGVMVDDSIQELQADIAPVQEVFNAAENKVATCTGRVEAMAAEIEKAINESEQRKVSTQARIENWESLIAQKRADIRTCKSKIQVLNDNLDAIDALDADVQEFEKSDIDLLKLLAEIERRFKDNGLAFETDFNQEVLRIMSDFKQYTEEAKEASSNINLLRTNLELALKNHSKEIKAIKDKQAQNEDDRKECAEAIAKLMGEVKDLQSAAEKIRQSQMFRRHEEADLEKQLAGVIACPKCNHEFILNVSVDVAEARASLEAIKKNISELAQSLADNETSFQDVVEQGKKKREEETALGQNARKLRAELEKADDRLQEARDKVEKSERLIEKATDRAKEAEKAKNRLRKRMFDEVFDIIDAAYKRAENLIKSLENDIETANGSIDSYKKAIEDAKNASKEDLIGSLQKSREEYQAELQEAIAEKNKVEGRLNELKSQESLFVQFKSYLSVSRIDALSVMINEFLQKIGSDIRLSLSGFTMLKSGKIREKIYITLLRNGIDCGSFDKFSQGERSRCELASILALHKLTNVSCEDGKGLDLLVIDEVLDGIDEAGLASILETLNQFQLTTLAVSHGAISESYPHKIVVCKTNGVSYVK